MNESRREYYRETLQAIIYETLYLSPEHLEDEAWDRAVDDLINSIELEGHYNGNNVATKNLHANQKSESDTAIAWCRSKNDVIHWLLVLVERHIDKNNFSDEDRLSYDAAKEQARRELGR